MVAVYAYDPLDPQTVSSPSTSPSNEDAGPGVFMSAAIDQIAHLISRRSSRTMPVEDGGWSHASVALVLREAEQDLELLLIQRAFTPGDPWSGQVAFPGGRAEPGDATPEATATRETHEELGIDLMDAELFRRIGPLDQVQARARVKINPLVVHPFVYSQRSSSAVDLRPNGEVASAFWVSLSYVTAENNRCWHDADGAHPPWEFPAVELGAERILWGLTYHMIIEFLGRVDRVSDVQGLCMPRQKQD